MPQIVGAALGVGAPVVGVAAGIGALLEAVPVAALALRVAGSAYPLLYLAWRVVGSGAIAEAEVARPLGVWEAAVFQWVNPKAWVFAIALVGTFLPEDVPLPAGSGGADRRRHRRRGRLVHDLGGRRCGALPIRCR